MFRGVRSATLDRASAVTAALFALIAAVAPLMKAAGVRTSVALLLGLVGVVGALVTLGLATLKLRASQREERARLFALPPLRLADAAGRGVFYDLGVDTEADQAIASLGVHTRHAPYIERDLDDDLRAKLAVAASESRVSLVVLSGPSKSGKSRSLLEAAAEALRDAWLVSPRNGQALAELSDVSLPRKMRHAPVVVWLDDIEPWARLGNDGLNATTLQGLSSLRRPVLVLATEGGKGINLAGPDAERFGEITADLLTRAWSRQLAPKLTGTELVRVRERFPQVADRVAREGLGEFMVAAPRLAAQFDRAVRDHPEGHAIVRVAIDLRRAGVLWPIRKAWLEELYADYLPYPPEPDAFLRGLRWATRSPYAKVALLERVTAEPGDTYALYDYIVEYANRQGWPINRSIWDKVVEEYSATEPELLTVGTVAYHAGDKARSERAASRADAIGSAVGAYNLGVLLEERGDTDGALAAWRRADKRGSGQAAFNLAAHFAEHGDITRADAAYRRAIGRGHTGALVNLGVLLERRGDRAGSEACYRAGHELGEPVGSLNLGILLQGMDDVEGAEAAYRRADELGSAEGAFNLGEVLRARGDLAGAEAAYLRAADRGFGSAACSLGVVRAECGDTEAAHSAWRWADDLGDADGAFNLALVLVSAGDHEAAEAGFVRADDRGSCRGAEAVAQILYRRGDMRGAEAAWRRADERGSADGAFNLGLTRARSGDLEGAESAWHRSDERGSAEAAVNLGSLLQSRGDFSGAAAAYGRAQKRGFSRASMPSKQCRTHGAFAAS
jgi:tetratricopeptide (TPR) repeat protein